MPATSSAPATDVAPEICLTAAGYGVAGKPILTDLTLRLTEARIGIVGYNGAGKTTLLRLIAGLIAPTGGTVRVSDLDPFRDRKGLVHRLGILFQNPDHQIIFPTVLEEISFGLRQQGQDSPSARKAAEAILARFGRSDWGPAPVTALSQGQRHFLCLMSVLAMNPATILLDEPFAGLDLPTIARLRRHLAALPQQLITITHDPATLAGYDRILWLMQGRVHADGGAEVLEQYSAEMTRLGEQDADTHLSA
ncbi:MAG: ABC transporter ATP-binding protein [Pseudorhodobacter sp.]|nr:ABC transporter ATP-binding protein [Pseudorhodobacter sp.]